MSQFSPSTWKKACEESQRWAEAMRRTPNPWYRRYLRGAILFLTLLSFFIVLIALAAEFGGPR